ncbi:hypothetical protein RvY_14576-2 [Ramazzottius varieornatus]|uniref:Potassium channel tetramerisation-type BTB domain-containing protein n=1 Tax=Ramazzottius varieornatus TaxID=947166 RepID=A0A1D1VRW5_RAMVA|nr:hypothetical protein RvY_14576-2 [Ramazzottius varieornatus]
MDIIEFTGHRRTLTWVRTPLYDREYELTERCNSDPELQPTFSLKSKRRNTLPNSPIEYIRKLRKRISGNVVKQVGTGDAVVQEIPVTKRTSAKGKENKAWDIVHFLVGGQSFQCPEWIFAGHPMTLLGNLQRRNVYFHAKTKSYVFADLLPDVFTAVLEYYQTGSLTRPERLTLNYFLEQLEIFDLEQTAVDQLLKKEGWSRGFLRNCKTILGFTP